MVLRFDVEGLFDMRGHRDRDAAVVKCRWRIGSSSQRAHTILFWYIYVRFSIVEPVQCGSAVTHIHQEI